LYGQIVEKYLFGVSPTLHRSGQMPLCLTIQAIKALHPEHLSTD
jgi:hypothetical protein